MDNATKTAPYRTIDRVVQYGIDRGLLRPEDTVYVRNRLLEQLQLLTYEYSDAPLSAEPLPQLLQTLTDYAVSQGICQDTNAARDRFDTALMGAMLPPPSAVIDAFWRHYKTSPQASTTYYYALSQDSNYIRRDRTALDVRWQTQTAFGALDITINLAKPEKDPRDIAAEKNAPQGGYPACLLCVENEGFAGHATRPARQNHRIIPVTVAGQPWAFQYSPYVYYNEHCIVLNKEHIPMVIDRTAFEKLLSLVAQFPHYFFGSNADLPIVGGSILSHEHFQGGGYEFPMASAAVAQTVTVRGFEDVEVGVVKWPMSVIRLRHTDTTRLVALADTMLTKWRAYSDESVEIFASSEGVPHNTITPIARQKNGVFELDLVLRNNRTTAEHPLGLFHPHAELHHIKKENIGLIEVMGLAVLPSRLKTEMETLRTALLTGQDVASIESIAKHSQWVASWQREIHLTAETIETVLQTEIGHVFENVLSHAGVFKRDEKGQAALLRFLDSM